MTIIRAQHDDPGSRVPRTVRIAAWALVAAIVVLSIVPASVRPGTVLPHILEHFAIYYVTGLAFGLGYRRRRDLLAVLLVTFSIAVEIAQLFVPGRHARISDLIVDAVAACLGLLTAVPVLRLYILWRARRTASTMAP